MTSSICARLLSREGLSLTPRVKHGVAFLQRLHERAEFVEAEFNAIDTIGFQRPFAQCLVQAHSIIEPILTNRVHNSRDII